MRMRTQKRSKEARRRSFEQINASWAIEGQVMDAADLELQAKLISRRVTHEQALLQLRRRYGADARR